MKMKVLIVFISSLFLFSGLTNALITDEITLENNLNLSKENTNILQKETVTVQIKFFIYGACTKDLKAMINYANSVFFDGSSDSNVNFATDGTNVTLGAENFTNLNTNAGQSNLLKKLKTDYKNCSNGINVVIAPSGSLPNGYLGITLFNYETGTATKPDGGIIINDTCNQTELNITLSHEFFHALGFSHEQVKWYNTTSGKNESKPIPSDLINSAGGNEGTKSPSLPVPPHGYGYYDKNGDCKLKEGEGEWKSQDGLWDINGNCTFGDADDKDSLLWGDASTMTGTNISRSQRENMTKTAKNNAGYRWSIVGQPINPPRYQNTNSKAVSDQVGDVPFGYLDIIGILVILYWEHNNIYFALKLSDLIPGEIPLSYSYLIDADNDITTGDNKGNDYMIMAIVSENHSMAGIFAWDMYYENWKYIHDVSSDLTQTVLHYSSRGGTAENLIGGNVLEFNVPLELLNLEYEGEMRITAKASDEMTRTFDECLDIFLSKERGLIPILNLVPYSGRPGDIIVCNGFDFTANAQVTIEFRGVVVKTIAADADGYFSTSFIVPNVGSGYYTVEAFDNNKEFDVRMFELLNQPPSKPTTPTGSNKIKINKLYTYSSLANDPEIDQIYYLFDWGDGNNSGWFGPFVSGATVNASHIWTAKGNYDIKVKAKDAYGDESNWSDPLSISTPRNKFADNTFYLQLLKKLINQFPLMKFIMEIH